MEEQITHLAKQGGNIVSISAPQSFVPTPAQVHVGAAKAGIEKMTRDLALEWGSNGIRVNTVVPGRRRTPRVCGGLRPRIRRSRRG